MQDFDWKNNVDNKEEKLRLAKRLAQRVRNNEIIGFGSGSTSYIAIKEIAKKVKEENLKIKAVPTSNIIKDLCDEIGIETIEYGTDEIDWCFDGADEVDPHNWLIKGMGAALYREKLNIKASEENYILVDSSKFVDYLGQNHPVPVEVEKEKVEAVINALKNLGAKKVVLRILENSNKPLITDNENYIIHAWFDKIEKDFEEKINSIDGVIENGLFIGYNIIIVK